MKKFLGLVMAVILSGCNAEVPTESTVTRTADVEQTSDPPAPPEPEAFQVQVTDAAPSRRLTNDGAFQTMWFTLNVPFDAKTRCTWWKEVPAKPEYDWEGTPWTAFGTVNGICDATGVAPQGFQKHEQWNVLDTNYMVVVRYNGGESYTTHSWSFEYDDGSVNHPVSVTAVTPEGNVFAHEDVTFRISVSDPDGDGTCSWELDNVEVSTNCYQHTIEASSSTRELVFTIDDGVNASDSVAWTIKPGAVITGVSPSTVNLSNGQSQTFTAAVTDTLSSGAQCLWRVDGSQEQLGSCSYNFTQSSSSTKKIEVELSYDGDLSGVVHTVYAHPPANQGVSIETYGPLAANIYLPEGSQQYAFSVDSYTDPDGDAHFEWFINGNQVNCDTSALCSWGNANREGVILWPFGEAGFNGHRIVLTAKLTDGQYSATRTWTIRRDSSIVNESVVVGNRCNQAGTTFTVFGKGFEASDKFWIEGQHIQLQVLSFTDDRATLRLPVNVLSGSQAVAVEKGSTINQTAFGFVNFNSAYCN